MSTISFSNPSKLTEPLLANLQHIPRYFLRPVHILKAYRRDDLRFDLVAGLTVAVIALPQAMAFAMIADLPPEVGIYTGIVAATVGGMWGSSNQMSTGAANAVSLLVLSTLTGVALAGTPEYLLAAGLLAVLAGLFQLTLGLSRLGFLINFVSHSVVVGFAAGAGILIALGQIKHLIGTDFSSRNLIDTAAGVSANIWRTNPATFALGIGTIILILLLRKFAPQVPNAIVSIAVAGLVVYWWGLDVPVIGQIPREFPPFVKLPLLDFALIRRLIPGALAVGTIALIQTAAISRSISAQTGQRLDSNQEIVGQGLANIAAGFFSGYAVAGSFSRSAVNFKSGARTSVSGIFASIAILTSMLLLAPLAVYVPRAALAGVLLVIAVGMIDRAEIGRILRTTRGDAFILAVTFIATVSLAIETAVFLGVAISFARFIIRTSLPQVVPVVPNERFTHFEPASPDSDICPQLCAVQISGDLYFGAVNHVEETILRYLTQNPDQRFVLIRMFAVNQCDFSGIHMLESLRQNCLDRGGDLYFMRVQPIVERVMRATGFYDELGEDHFLDDDTAIPHIFHRVLDPAICIYECPVRVFKECQNLPKQTAPLNFSLASDIRPDSVASVAPRDLWAQISGSDHAPLVIDVREPREFKHGAIPESLLLPLPRLADYLPAIPQDKDVVLVCRGGRRSLRAATYLKSKGLTHVKILRGGILAWEAAGLLEAVE